MTLTPTTTGWRKALDGEDVYVQGDGWVWSHVMKGWYYAPDLALQVPPPPLARRLKDEKHRLTHGWPPVLKALAIRNGVKGGGFWLGMLYRILLLWIWVVVIFEWGIHNVAQTWHRFVYATYKGETPYETVWYSEQPEDATYVVGLLFALLVSAALWYLLYMHLCYTVDTHKGHLLFGGIMAHTAYQTLKKARAHDAMVAVRDGTRAAGGH